MFTRKDWGPSVNASALMMPGTFHLPVTNGRCTPLMLEEAGSASVDYPWDALARAMLGVRVILNESVITSGELWGRKYVLPTHAILPHVAPATWQV